LCNYTLQPANVKVLKTSVASILWKLFQLFRRIINASAASQKCRPFSVDFIERNRCKSSATRPGDCGELSSAVTLFFDKKSSYLHRPVCWSIVVEKPTVGSPFYGVFPSDYNPKSTKMSMYISLLIVENPVNYTSEFREKFEATTYNW